MKDEFDQIAEENNLSVGKVHKVLNETGENNAIG